MKYPNKLDKKMRSDFHQQSLYFFREGHNGETYPITSIKIGKNQYCARVPNLIEIYFETALKNLESSKELSNKFSKNIIGKINGDIDIPQIDDKLFQDFANAIIHVVLFLHLSVEAFLNKIIEDCDDSYVYIESKPETIDGQKVMREIRSDKRYIIRKFSFNDKLKKVIPDITKKDFVKNKFNNKLVSHIEDINRKRNSLVHFKASYDSHMEIMKYLSDKNLEDYFNSVTKYFNLITPDFVRVEKERIN